MTPGCEVACAVQVGNDDHFIWAHPVGSDIVRAETGGVSFWTFQPGTQPPGWPTLALIRGRIVAELDPATFTIVNLVAQQGASVQDLCAALQ